MTALTYASADPVVREDLVQAHREAWARLARPGTWWDGANRVAIAAEVRNAWDCNHCRACKAALSPYAMEGTHQSLGVLSDTLVDVIHRVVTDPGRLTRAWFDRSLDAGLSEQEFVEAIGVVVTTVSIDMFCRAMGLPPHTLPAPEDGAPTRVRPDGAKGGTAWVAMLFPEDMNDQEKALLAHSYLTPEPTYVRTALSVVPEEAAALFHLVDAQYLPADIMADPDAKYRALSRAQMELIAGRVSAINGCFY